MNPSDDCIVRLQAQLQARADKKTCAFWTGYVKDAAPFRGVAMGNIRSVLHAWLAEEGIANLPLDQQRDTALALIREPYTEDKLAGILYLQEVLIPAGTVGCGAADLERFATLITEGWLYDWNAVDWFCVRVLEPLAERYGAPCAQSIAAWRESDHLWQRRASAVAFANLARRGERNFPGFTNMLLETCAANVAHPERFSQTAAGWLLRELSHANPNLVAAFVADRLPQFSREALNMATAKLPPEVRADLKARYGAHAKTGRAKKSL
jgi:3-methyladenine DNA glycosylase AlkD